MKTWNQTILESEPLLAPESDESLMVRVMEGDRAAFDSIYARFAPRIQAFVRRFVGRTDVAEDLTQEIFLKVYRNPKAFDPRARFTTWLFAVARNACIDYLRLKKLPTIPAGVPTKEDGESRIEPASKAAGPDDIALRRELGVHAERILQELSPKLREVLVLCGMQGLSYEEASEIIGCPIKTVSSRLSRARDQFFRSFQLVLDGRSDPSGSES